MSDEALALDITNIITDSDLDGVVTGAILRRWWPDAKIRFGHPGNLRAGMMDDLINRNTAICDLPRHSKCGLSIDHHQSNKPIDNEDSGTVVLWEETPSAARIAYNILKEKLDLTDLTEMMIWVDKLDGGSISIDEFMGNNPVLWLGRIIGEDEKVTMNILESIQNRVPVKDILEISEIRKKLEERRGKQEYLNEIISENIQIIDRLAIARLENLKVRSNGYHVTAIAGEECDACLVIHGDIGAGFEEEGSYPVSASFYTNSFIHKSGGVFDLTKLATRFDNDGGGHANACGCRIKSINDGIVGDQCATEEDIQKNIDEWLNIWSQR
jgi:oligoribonuclease NrnB/cAMP/cGMP phosphodiesterase (DHH superfamily)